MIRLNSKKAACLFCGEPDGSAGLHNASTYNIDKKVRECAVEHNDTVLLAKLAPGDMIALEAKCHKCLAAFNDTALLAKLAPGDMIALEAKCHKCLAALYNRARSASSNSSIGECHNDYESIAFAVLVAYMEDYHKETSVAPVFKLSDYITHIWHSLVLKLMDAFTHPD